MEQTPAVSSVEKARPTWRLLPQDQMVDRVKQIIDTRSGSLHLPYEEYVDEYAKDKLAVLEGQNVDVVFVKEEYLQLPSEDGRMQLDPVHEQILRSSHTRAGFIEYFLPEYEANLRNSPPPLKQYGQLRHDQLCKGKRFAYGMTIAEALEKDAFVATADIADKPSYTTTHSAIPAFLGIGATVFPVFFLEQVLKHHGVQLPENTSINLIKILNIPHVAGPLQILMSEVMRQTNRFTGKHNKGFGIEKSNDIGLLDRALEEITFSLEKARRKAVADGINTLAQQFRQSPQSLHKPVFVVNYPPAHAERIIRHLLHPSHIADRSQGLYKVLGHNLNWDVGLWQKKDMLARLADRPELTHWDLISSTAI